MEPLELPARRRRTHLPRGHVVAAVEREAWARHHGISLRRDNKSTTPTSGCLNTTTDLLALVPADRSKHGGLIGVYAPPIELLKV